jgi:DNA-binding response OmpR family regulator
LKHIKHHKVDLAVVSYDLHGLDGLQLSQLIRQRWPEVRLVLMTDLGNNQPYRVRNWPEFDGFFTKPFSMTRFLEVVGYLLEPERSRLTKFSTNGKNALAKNSSAFQLGPVLGNR